MNKQINLVSDALEYYDGNYEKYNDLFKSVRYIKFSSTQNDMEHNIIHLYDNDKKEILKSRYEIIGLFNNTTSTWTWAWSISNFRKNTTYIARKILNYGAELDPDAKFLKTELVTSRFRVANDIQLDIHAGIASYLSKQPLVYRYNAYMSTKMRITSDGYVDVTPPDDSLDTFTTYFMFLLDYKDAKI